MSWRPMTGADLPTVVAIAAAVHPGFPERPEVLAEKRALCPAGALVAEGDGQAVGYALAHPWTAATPPPLDTFLERLPERPDCLYLHDVALLPAARGRGLARAVVGHWVTVATRAGLPRLTLIAVNGSAPAWRALGFTASTEGGAARAAKLASYGPEAVYMERAVSAGR